MTDRMRSIDEVYRTAIAAAGADVGQTATRMTSVGCVYWHDDRPGPSIYVEQRPAKDASSGGYWCFPRHAVARANAPELPPRLLKHIQETAVMVPPTRTDAYVNAGCWPLCGSGASTGEVELLAHRVDGDPLFEHAGSGIGRWIGAKELQQKMRAGEWLVEPNVMRVLEVITQWCTEQQNPSLSERLLAAARQASENCDLWNLADGVAVCPVRTPTLPPATHTNCYFIGDGAVAIVDPATPYADEQDRLIIALRGFLGVKRRLAMVILTHHHQDHVGAANRIAGEFAVPIVAHEATAQRLRPGVDVQRWVTDDETIELPGTDSVRTLRVIHTPGHAPGHVCILDLRTSFVIAGDMVAGDSTILIDPSEGDMALYLDSLQKLAALEPAALLPAHGGVITDVQERLAEYRAHRLWREARVVAALAECGPATSAELTKAAYRDVPVAIHALAERSLIAHLVKLEGEKRAEQRTNRWQRTPEAPAADAG